MLSDEIDTSIGLSMGLGSTEDPLTWPDATFTRMNISALALRVDDVRTKHSTGARPRRVMAVSGEDGDARHKAGHVRGTTSSGYA